MDDSISRAAAIEVAAAIWSVTGDLNVAKVWDQLKGLQSAQPERLRDDDFETIRIHLNAYKERLCNQHRWKEAEEYQRIIDRFMSFASAQSEIIRCKDCIVHGICRFEQGLGLDGYCSQAERRR